VKNDHKQGSASCLGREHDNPHTIDTPTLYECDTRLAATQRLIVYRRKSSIIQSEVIDKVPVDVGATTDAARRGDIVDRRFRFDSACGVGLSRSSDIDALPCSSSRTCSNTNCYFRKSVGTFKAMSFVFCSWVMRPSTAGEQPIVDFQKMPTCAIEPPMAFSRYCSRKSIFA
jgi:hypothetical protein